MNPFQKLLQSIGASGITRASGLIDDVVRPRLLVDSQRPIQRSVGNIRDILEKARPNSKSQQEFSRLIEGPINFSRSLSPSVIRTNFENPTQRFLQEYAPTQRSVGASVVDNFASSGGGGLTRELMRRAGGGSLERVAEKLVPKGAIQQGAGFLNSAFRPSSAMGNVMNAIPGISNLPGIAKNMIAPASAAGMAGYLLSLEGSTPNNYKSLGYKSEEDMKNKIRQQEAREGILASSLDDGRYIPGAQQKQFKVPALTNVLNINTSSDNNNVDNRRPDNFSSPRNTEAERRAYLSELSSVAQQTAQNPLLNQYNALRKPDSRAAEDLGMQMFALANPESAKKVTPGQAGYDVIQRVYPQATTAAMLPAPVDPTGLTEEERQAIANQMFFNQY